MEIKITETQEFEFPGKTTRAPGCDQRQDERYGPARPLDESELHLQSLKLQAPALLQLRHPFFPGNPNSQGNKHTSDRDTAMSNCELHGCAVNKGTLLSLLRPQEHPTNAALSVTTSQDTTKSPLATQYKLLTAINNTVSIKGSGSNQ